MYPDDRRALYRLTSSLIGRASRLGMEANLGPQVSERRPGPTFGDVTPDRVTGSLGAAVRVLGEGCQSSVGAVGAARLLLQLTVKRLWVSTDGLRSGAGAALLKRQWRPALLTARHPIGPISSKAEHAHSHQCLRQGMRSEPDKATTPRRLPRLVRRLPTRAHDARDLSARVQRGCVAVSLRKT